MDKVRFGRALGVGARQAAKTLMSAAEAAAAPDPRRPGGTTERPVAAAGNQQTAARSAGSPRVVVDARVVGAQAKTLKNSVWSPFARFSSVLWLEVTGTFFALFALIAALQVWKFHAAVMSPGSPDARRLYVYVVIFALFGYFTVSSFIRASRRQRR